MNARSRRELGFGLLLGGLAFALLRRVVKGRRSSSRLPYYFALAGASLWALPKRRASYAGLSAVITGGSRGLGFAMARALLEDGASVTLLARDAEELDRACAQLNEHSDRVFSVVCDVTQFEALETALAEARARFGKVDFFVHNAGSVTVGPFASMTDEDFSAQMRIHFDAAVQGLRAIHPYLRMQDGGRILMVSSIGGRVPIPHMAPYCASKFALGGFAQAVRPELLRDGISLTVAYPGLMRTGSPKQAVFKGDHEREFAWFATGDSIPGLSMSAASAARKMLDAALEGRAEIVVGLPAKLADTFYHSFPELFASLSAVATRFLPSDRSKERHTGADSRGLFSSWSWTAPLRRISAKAEREHNQADKIDAAYNMGLRATNGNLTP